MQHRTAHLTDPASGLACLLLVTLPLTAIAQGPAKSGEHVYKETCAACHGTGLNKAPKYGDKTDWKPLIREGQAILSAEGWIGVRAMPARGGNPTLSLEEFSGAVAYMSRAAGSKWQAPDGAMLARIKAEVAKRQKQGK